jgi:signal transduction histidine kinase
LSRQQANERSLIWRLVAVIFTATAVVFVVAALLFANRIQRQAEAGMDNRLQSIALDLFAGLSFDSDGTPVLNRIPEGSEFEDRLSGWYWQIRRAGETIARSRSLLLEDLPPGRTGQDRIVGPEGALLRTAVLRRQLPNSTPLVIQVSAPQRVIDEAVTAELWLLAIGLTLLLLVLLAVTGWLLTRGLSPLRRIQNDLGAMISGRTGALQLTGYRELDGMVKLINSLVEQGRAQIAANRESANKLAHALKTPLALIAARTDASGSSPDPEIRSSIEIMRGHIEHSLNRVRLAGPRQGLTERVPVEPVIDDLMFAFAHAYRDRNIAQEIDVATGTAFLGDKDDLVELLGNLLDNAHRFAASRVCVKAETKGDRVAVRILDDGPGFRNPKLATAIEGARDRESPRGLGVTIAQEIVKAYGGALRFLPGDSGSGLSIEIDLPGALPATA